MLMRMEIFNEKIIVNILVSWDLSHGISYKLAYALDHGTKTDTMI